MCRDSQSLFKKMAASGAGQPKRMTLESGPMTFHDIITGIVCFLTLADKVRTSRGTTTQDPTPFHVPLRYKDAPCDIRGCGPALLQRQLAERASDILAAIAAGPCANGQHREPPAPKLPGA